MKVTTWDLETTGFPNYKAKASDPCQPHIVEIAAVMHEDGKLVKELHLISKPEGWEIPKEVSDIHGITNEMAASMGTPEWENVKELLALLNEADVCVAHNGSFDAYVLRCAVRRFDLVPYVENDHDPLKTKGKSYCTMTAMTDECNLPGRYGKPKWPKLSEAYRHAFGKDFENAHGAFSDVLATYELYLWKTAKDAGKAVAV
jgi:DNA polymerase-3 subunit epsilon